MSTIMGTVCRNLILVWVVALVPRVSYAFDSGSTGADGAFAPTANTTLTLPPDGVFNFTSMNSPAGVTVTFERNALNTPVTILASGDVTIAGRIDIRGGNAPEVGATSGNIVGSSAQGGPGGFDGGRGSVNTRGGWGRGPGGGEGGTRSSAASSCGCPGGCGGAGAGFRTSGTSRNCGTGNIAIGGPSYGIAELQPLVGGSGGGGGAGATGTPSISLSFPGAGGGGGGGAILIAASGTVAITGAILADGGRGGNRILDLPGGPSGAGGGGSGGAIRIVATTISGDGVISAIGGGGGTGDSTSFDGAAGSVGRIRLESENFTRTAGTTPELSFASPQALFVAGMPALRISSVGGAPTPALPSGSGDITLPATTPNPVTVEFAASGVPLGTTVALKAIPAVGTAVSATSGGLSGTVENSTASVSVNLPQGPSVLFAQVSYTVTAFLGDQMSRFAQGERVERIEIATDVEGSRTTFITVTGKKYTYPSNLAAFSEETES